MKRGLVFLFLLPWISIVAQAQGHQNIVSFNAVASVTAGAPTYNVYKDHGCTGTWVKLNATPLTATTYTDTGLVDGEVNCYTPTATLPGQAESPVGGAGVLRVVTPAYTAAKLITPSPGGAVVSGQ